MIDARNPLVSIIIRTKNEERWITSCLQSVSSQKYQNIEIVIVDNFSTDQTLARAREFTIKELSIEKFLPGKAINDGIRVSTGEIIVCLSGHCIPVNDEWLGNLVRNLNDRTVAGVYGRQQPLSYSSDFDKRDLVTVFGLDRKVQLRDSFFHNANSAFRRDVWEKYPFDENVTNIEDRVWGNQVISAGMKLVYEPDASVYHWHGIHQDLNPDRARRVVRILETIEGLIPPSPSQEPEKLNTIAIIPVRGKSIKLNDHFLIKYSIEAAKSADYIKKVIVSTDDPETAALAESFGAEIPFLRPKSLSEEYIDIVDVLSYTMAEIERRGISPDLIVCLEETYPIRPVKFLDAMIQRLIDEGLDTVVAGRHEDRGIWTESDGSVKLLGDGFMPRKLKKDKNLIGLLGLGFVTRASTLRTGEILGGRVGIYEIDNPLYTIEFNRGMPFDFMKILVDKLL